MKLKVILLLFLISATLYAKNSLLYFEGNKHFSDRELYEALNLYKPYFYEFYKKQPGINPKIVPLIKDTLRDFYKSEGFYHTNIVTFKKDSSIILKITENAPIIITDIKIKSKLKTKKAILFKVGDIFSAKKFIQSKKAFKNLYYNAGYANAAFNTKAYIDIEKNSAKLIYQAVPNKICRFTNIDISTSINIDKDIIRSLLYFDVGDIYSPSSIDESYKNLYAYDGISQVIIRTKNYNVTDVNATVKVKETDKPIRFQIGLGASSDEGPTASVGIKHRNFYGNLKTIALNTQVTRIKQKVQLLYTMPLARKNIFGSEINVQNENFFGFKESRILTKAHLTQRDQFNWFQESLIVDISQSYASSDTTLFPNQNLLLVSPVFQWIYNTRDKVLSPTKGYFINAQIQGSLLSSISDATYQKSQLGAGYILPLHPTILAAKIKIGSLRTYAGDVPNSYRFFAGGMNSNRAYGYRQLGPKDDQNNPVGFDSIIETTLEYRFHLYQKFYGVLFNDNTFIGTTYLPDTQNGYFSLGGGLRYKTFIGPLAFDIGFDPKHPMQQYAVHFHIGEMF